MAKNALVTAPIEYSYPLAEWIASEHASGDSIAQLCRAHADTIPGPLVIRRWRRDYPAFDLIMREAEKARAEILADETIAIADDEGRIPAQARLAVSSRQWLAGRLDRDRYGAIAVSGPQVAAATDHGDMSDDDLQAIIRAGMRASAIEGEAERVENVPPGTPPKGQMTGLEEKDGTDPTTPKIFSVENPSQESTNDSSGVDITPVVGGQIDPTGFGTRVEFVSEPLVGMAAVNSDGDSADVGSVVAAVNSNSHDEDF